MTITPLLMFVTRSVAGGAVAMMPNVLPVLVIFGAMGWLGINIDIGSMMSASIALGVAVDDTIHYSLGSAGTWGDSATAGRRFARLIGIAARRPCRRP